MQLPFPLPLTATPSWLDYAILVSLLAMTAFTLLTLAQRVAPGWPG